jgi:hypothetical protein
MKLPLTLKYQPYGLYFTISIILDVHGISKIF